ncbi:MAG: hypothetical protein PHD57_12935 [Desulfobacterales bacterium]|nr:hypothetical protein [Desulfobacterales bacterium]
MPDKFLRNRFFLQQGVEKQDSGRQERRAAMRQAQHIQAYVSTGETRNAEWLPQAQFFDSLPRRAPAKNEEHPSTDVQECIWLAVVDFQNKWCCIFGLN